MRVAIALIEGYSFSRDPEELGFRGLAAAARQIEELGFDGILSSETAGHDPFFPLLLAAEHTRRVELATGIAVSFPRSPMVVAQMAWDLQRLSQGRFALGLGTQVKGHNERRYGTPWTGPPGPRMREYVQCLRAIFATFQSREQPRWFEGEHYRFSMLPPVFAPEAIEHPHIPIHAAALNPHMAQLAGELCDGVFAHPVCTARYLREVLVPAVAEGARRAGRSPDEIDVRGAPIVVTGRDATELAEECELLKRRISFYASTRTYRRVFELHGWQELGERLHALSLENRWQDMAKLVPDEMAEEFATIGRLDEIGDRLRERFGDVLTTLNLPTDFPRNTPEDARLARATVETLQRG